MEYQNPVVAAANTIVKCRLSYRGELLLEVRKLSVIAARPIFFICICTIPLLLTMKRIVMPRVRIESVIPLEKAMARALMVDVTDAVVEALRLPPDDRTVSFVTHDPELFRMKPPYQLFIEIALFLGRTKAAKKRLYQTILYRLSEKHGIDSGSVMILLNEQPRENWALRGGIPGDEIDLGYRVDV
ncbi:MAG: tautomerase family protein [Chitinispirillaceae bacterium]|nr:tautomerase family protein [Chitinispirillaceae bacterium]